MNMAKYCKDKGMNLSQYETFKANITEIAKAIKTNTTDTRGMYYPITDIIPYNANPDMRIFLIQELKQLGFEFYDNCTLYRT